MTASGTRIVGVRFIRETGSMRAVRPAVSTTLTMPSSSRRKVKLTRPLQSSRSTVTRKSKEFIAGTYRSLVQVVRRGPCVESILNVKRLNFPETFSLGTLRLLGRTTRYGRVSLLAETRFTSYFCKPADLRVLSYAHVPRGRGVSGTWRETRRNGPQVTGGRLVRGF